MSIHSPLLSFPYTPDSVTLLSEALFLRLKAVLFASRAFKCFIKWIQFSKKKLFFFVIF